MSKRRLKKPRKLTKKRRPQPQAGFSGDLPMKDRRALEKTMADIGKLISEREFGSIEEINAFLQGVVDSGEVPEPESRTPLEEAQDVMYQAWDATGSKRVKLARKALEISEDCADAYVLLAEETARSPQDALQLYEKGVKAGERAIGPEAFEENTGHFWGVMETRPYMRARVGLAQCLWLTGARQQAVEHYKDMLRLNPNDNQGIRDLLLNCLLELGDDEAARELLERYKEDGSAMWLYSRALLRFRKDGASKAATAALRKAIEFNPFVPPYLLDKKKLPTSLPPYMGFGDDLEAMHYAFDAKSLWRKNKEALEWLQKAFEGAKS